MSLIFRVAEAKMDRLGPELETSLQGDGKIYESVSLQNPFGLGQTTNLMRSLEDNGTRGPIRINANFSSLFGGDVHKEIFAEYDGAVTRMHNSNSAPPGHLRRAKLLTRLLIGRPDHEFAELEFNGAFDDSDED